MALDCRCIVNLTAQNEHDTDSTREQLASQRVKDTISHSVLYCLYTTLAFICHVLEKPARDKMVVGVNSTPHTRTFADRSLCVTTIRLSSGVRLEAARENLGCLRNCVNRSAALLYCGVVHQFMSLICGQGRAPSAGFDKSEIFEFPRIFSSPSLL